MYRLLLLEALHHGLQFAFLFVYVQQFGKTVESLAAIQEHKRCIEMVSQSTLDARRTSHQLGWLKHVETL